MGRLYSVERLSEILLQIQLRTVTTAGVEVRGAWHGTVVNRQIGSSDDLHAHKDLQAALCPTA
jgi:hypothetical protein